MPTTKSQQAFSSARRRAFIQDVLAELSGRSRELLPFDQVREQLRLTTPELGRAKLQRVPLDRIVGSVGRYRDFNRAFLPRGHLDAARWMRVAELSSAEQLPPIDVFKVGDAYFVRDGNHRVSVARARGLEEIDARVLEIQARVPFDADTSVDDLILKAEYTRFLEATSLDRTVPDQRIEVTRAGGYLSLLQHIEVHQFYLGLRSDRFPTLPDAAFDWCQTVYRPVVERIREAGVLSRFPGRTEADLYLWIAENRAQLQMRYLQPQDLRAAITSLGRRGRRHWLLRWMGKCRPASDATDRTRHHTRSAE